MGVAVDAIYAEFHVFLETKFFSIPKLLIVIGSFIVIITVYGFWSAFKENYLHSLIFTVLLGIIFILELAAGISGLALRSNAEALIRKSLNNSIYEYNSVKPNDQTVLWDYVQETVGSLTSPYLPFNNIIFEQFTCCGIDNYTDWNRKLGPDVLPLSCCQIPSGVVGTFQCTAHIEDINRYSKGCLAEFTEFIANHAVSLGTAGSLIAIVQVSP